jgi:Dolichyl-phosphate-mannose-protein mannosyltransferase
MSNRWKQALPNTIAFLAMLAYFLFFARDGVHAHFAADDMMNIGQPWARGFWTTVGDNLHFWSTAVRPMGGLYYLSIYRMFGLNPLPYRIVALAFLFGGAWFSYLIAELLTKSRAIALATGILCCVHATMVDTYFGTDTIYDILARFFSMLALLLYIRIRERGQIPSVGQTLLILFCFAAALDSKEISVIVAGSIVSYEVIFHGWPRRWSWLKQEGLVPALLVGLTLIYVVGKIFGANPLSNLEAYRIVLSKDRYLDNNLAYFRSYFYESLIDSRTGLLALDIALLLLFSNRLPAVRWATFYVLTATLPISFIVTRGGSSLLVPLFGWAFLVPTLVASIWTPSWKYSRWAIRLSLALLCLYCVETTYGYWKPQPPVFFKNYEKTWRVITQMKNLHFQPKPGSRVIIFNDPWPHDWDMTFIAELTWDDPSVQITLANRLPVPPSPEELAKYDSVLEFGPDGEPRVVR